MKSPRDVIIRPVVSEKSYAELEANRYTFLVHPEANKTEIKEAIQQIWNVRVLNVNTMNRKGKVKRTLKDRAYFYKPAVSRSHVTTQHITDIVDRLFGGSAESLVMSLVETKHLTPKKLARLQRLLEEEGKK